MSQNFYSVGEVVKRLKATQSRVRWALGKLEVPPPRVGKTIVIPADWLPGIQAAMLEDRRLKKNRKKTKVRLRLRGYP